ncbi:HAD-IB family phosphatase [candidate division GN15 bacterium]|nr:HAD-IB family phosphatase [candidate division GN15 bacterium]
MMRHSNLPDPQNRLVVFCDFDGTVSRRDIGYHFFHHFSGGKIQKLIPDWKAGVMSSREILTREAEMSTVHQEEVEPFLEQFEISPGFVDFVTLCEQNHVPVHIISDGLDIYITWLLKRYQLERLPVMSNTATLDSGRITLQFPFDNGACERCGNCKGERIRQYRQSHPGTNVVFVGDGMSDLCAIDEADILFAKKDLENYCQANNIDYVPYHHFPDVARWLLARGYLQK